MAGASDSLDWYRPSASGLRFPKPVVRSRTGRAAALAIPIADPVRARNGPLNFETGPGGPPAPQESPIPLSATTPHRVLPHTRRHVGLPRATHGETTWWRTTTDDSAGAWPIRA